ncbi:hypothetical protein [Streptomyces bauhiniae]
MQQEIRDEEIRSESSTSENLGEPVEVIDYSALDFDALQAMERPGSLCNTASL